MKNIPLHSAPHWAETDWFREGEDDLVHCFYHQAAASIGLHDNDFYELNIVVGGSGEHALGDARQDVEPGCICVIPPGQRHGYASDGDLIVFHALLRSRFLDRYVNELQSLPGFLLLFEISPYINRCSAQVLHFRLSQNDFARLAPDLDRLIDAEKSEYPGRSIQKTLHMLCLLGGLSASLYQMNRRIIALPDANAQLVLRSMEYVRSSNDPDLSVDKLAEAANMSRSSYTILFKRLAGCTPHAFITRCRVANARLQLSATDHSMAEIAQRCGFYDSPHFIRVFKQQVGVTPSVYRKLHAGRVSYAACTIMPDPHAAIDRG